jgi:hypothetical protein
MAQDDFLNFQSAVEWPDLRPANEHATDELRPLYSFLPSVFDKLVLAGRLEEICESPIEVELGVQFLIAFRAIGNDDFELIPQRVLGPFRYDFAITRQGKLIGLVECDGKEFHSTSEQVANDSEGQAGGANGCSDVQILRLRYLARPEGMRS